MSDPWIGEIRIFGGKAAPAGWAVCNGQLLPISQNTDLFQVIGTKFGGDGKTNFAVPNLQGMVPMAFGNGTGLSPHVMGETGGSQAVTLGVDAMPLHIHSFSVDPAVRKERSSVANNVPAGAPAGMNFYSSSSPNVSMNPGMLASAGGGQPHDNMQPYLVLNFCIALQGTYPMNY